MPVHFEIFLTFLSEDSHYKILGEGKPSKLFWPLWVEKWIMGHKGKNWEADEGVPVIVLANGRLTWSQGAALEVEK